MTYQAVCFFDLDGTLLNAEHQVDVTVQSAIKQLKENKVLPIIATGRGLTQLDTIREQSGIHSVVALNGAYIEVNGQMIYEEIIPTPVVERFADFSNQLHKGVSYLNDRKVWVDKVSPYIETSYAAFNIAPPAEMPGGFHNEKVHMLLAMNDELELDNYYLDEFPELNFFRNSIRTIDVVNQGTDKGTGVAKILDYLGHQDLPTYAFGDGANDLALLNAVDYGVAMGNGIDELKEIATFVTDKNTEGGLIKAFKHFDLI